MLRRALRAAAVMLASFLTPSTPQCADTWTARSGPPELLELSSHSLRLLSAEEYRSEVERLRGRPDLVPLREVPADVGSEALYCITSVGEKLITVILTQKAGGYEARVDLNADGTIGPDERRAMTARGAVHEVSFETLVPGSGDGVGGATFQPTKLEFRPDRRELSLFAETLRRGIVGVGRRSVAFGLLGDRGRYGYAGGTVFFDLDGDGGFSLDDPFSCPQVRAEDSLSIHQLYRVSSWPSPFLIGRDGKILERWIGAGGDPRPIRALPLNGVASLAVAILARSAGGP